MIQEKELGSLKLNDNAAMKIKHHIFNLILSCSGHICL